MKTNITYQKNKKILYHLILFFIISKTNLLNSLRITFPMPGIVTNTCRIEGTAEPYETIRIFIGKKEKKNEMQEIKRIVADKNGKWSCCPEFPIDKIYYEFKNTITVYNSSYQSIQQEISIKVKPIKLIFVNNSCKSLLFHIRYINNINELDFPLMLHPKSKVSLELYHIDGFFYLYTFVCGKIVTRFKIEPYQSRGLLPEDFAIFPLMKPYSEFQNFLNDYNRDKKTKLIQCINDIIPIDLINIIDDYAYPDENEFVSKKVETIEYRIILENNKPKLIGENEYNRLKKEVDEDPQKMKPFCIH